MAQVTKGMMYKKTMNDQGEVTGKIPFFPKTLSDSVFMSDGTTVDNTIANINKKIWTGTHEQFDDAIASGEIVDGTIVCFTDDEE